MESFASFIAAFWPLLLGAAVSLLVAACATAAESAVLYADKGHLREQADGGDPRAAAVLALTLDRDRLHAAMLVVRTVFTVLAAVLAALAAAPVFGRSLPAAATATLVMTALALVFVELAPNGIACRQADRLARAAVPVLRPAMRLLSPLTGAIVRTANLLTGQEEHGLTYTTAVTEEDIKALINLGEERGSLKEEERDLLHKVFAFGDTLASESMRPRTDIVSVPAEATLQDILLLVSEFGYSRYPVIEETVDAVTGILYIKDILIAMATGEVKREDGVRQFIRPAFFIPENKRVSELLSEMQRERFQIAIVIDEYGGTAGLVTLEDLIEEIVGSIHDEIESAVKDVEIVDEKNFVISGQSDLDEVNELLDTNLHSEDFNTLGGFLFGLFGRLPRPGEQLKYKNLKLEVLEFDGRRISKIKVTKLE